MSATTKAFHLTGWHVLGMLTLFFGTDIAINVGYISAALKTFPGEVAEDPYEAGVTYDKTLAEAAIEQKLGWRANVDRVQSGPHGAAITVRWADKAGQPLVGAKVVGELKRPATERQNTSLTFAQIAPGVYRAQTAAGAGAWDLTVTAADGHGHQRTADRRLVWP